MVANHEKAAMRVSDDTFAIAYELVKRAGVASMLRRWQREDGIEDRSDRTSYPRFTVEAVVVVVYLLISVGVTVTIAAIVRATYALSDAQLGRVGMVLTAADRERFRRPAEHRREYHRVWAWLAGQLRPIDPAPDLAARRCTNAEHRSRLSARDSRLADDIRCRVDRGQALIDAIVHASIDWPAMGGYRGDMIADETIIPTAATTHGLGARPNARRSAATGSGYYQREYDYNLSTSDNSGAGAARVVKRGYGIGVTAVSAVGPIRTPNLVPRVIVAIRIHPPTAGSGQALVSCLDTIDRNDDIPKPARRQRNRTITVDMGYIGKRAVSEALLERRIDAIHAFPQRRGKGGTMTTNAYTYPSTWPPDDDWTQHNRCDPGPIMAWGEFYCPAAADLLGANPTTRRRVLAERRGGFAAHDHMLAQRSPFIMGRLSRPYRSDTKRAARRPGEARDQRWKIDLQCPAIQGRVACPFVEGDDIEPGSVPTARPAWLPEDKRCCHSQVTVTLTEQQIKSFQPALTPGTWEFASVLEGRRGLTEQRFSHLKNPSVSGLRALNYGPRREPLMLLHVALAVAVSNRSLQRGHTTDSTDVVAKGLREIDDALGYRAQRRGPLT